MCHPYILRARKLQLDSDSGVPIWPSSAGNGSNDCLPAVVNVPKCHSSNDTYKMFPN